MKKIIEYLRKEGAQPLTSIRLELGLSMKEAERWMKILHVKDIVGEVVDVDTGLKTYQLLPGGEAAGREVDKRIRRTPDTKKKKQNRGAKYSEGKVCPKCGTPITNTSTMCRKCAAKKRYEKRNEAGKAKKTAKPEAEEEAIVEEAKEAETKKTKPRHRIDFEMRSMLQQEQTKVERLSVSLARHKEMVTTGRENIIRLHAEATDAENTRQELRQEIDDLTERVEAEDRVLRWYDTVLESIVRAGEKMAREKS